MSNAFNALGINEELSALLVRNGITEPTPVQTKAIPILLEGEDIIAQAQTGTGKTLAFALPILQRINPTKEQTQALILTPTRELAIQIKSELSKLAQAVGVSVLAAYGGQDVEAQIHKLKRSPHIVVATPGRLLDHMRRETINIGKLSMLVLDEADQMLHMGFLTEVESIITQTPKARQTMLFSATMPDAVRRLAQEYMKTPSDVRIKSANVTLDSIKQLVYETTDRGKQKALVDLLQRHQPYLAVIFCRTKVRAKKLNEALQDLGFESDELHGDLTQAKREQVMKRFRDSRLQILVATDVAARGLDVEGVTHVYNYDVPQDGELYIHRIGRTGRAGHEGFAVTLATPYDKNTLIQIEQSIQARLERRSIDRDGAESAPSERNEREDRRGGQRGRRDNGRGSAGNERSGGRQRGQRGGAQQAEGREERGKQSGTQRSRRPGASRNLASERANRASDRAAERAGIRISNDPDNPWTQLREDAGSRNQGGGRNTSRGENRRPGNRGGATSSARGGASGGSARGGSSGWQGGRGKQSGTSSGPRSGGRPSSSSRGRNR